MVKINYQELQIDHIVEFSQDSTIFAAARENGNGHLRLFLIYRDSGNVYTRNGRADSWEQLFGSDKETILGRIKAASNVPVYKVNGSH